MANINNNLNKIKNAVLGVDVRDSIHDGIKAINEEVESTTDRQVQLEGTFDELLINAGNSNAEVAAARVDSTGKSHGTLGKRLNNFDSQIKDKASKQELEVERQRIDSFTRLAEGSTTGDAELIDARIGADGIVYNNIGSANRTQFNFTKDKINDIKKILNNKNSVKTANLFNKSTYDENKYINNTTGDLSSYTGWFASDYININPNTEYLILKAPEDVYVDAQNSYYAFYDKDKTYISGGVHQSGNILSPETAKYIRFSAEEKNREYIMFGEKQNLNVFYGKDKSYYVDYGYVSFKRVDTLEGSVDTLEGSVDMLGMDLASLKETINLFNKSIYTANKYIDNTTGDLSDYLGWFASDYIEINPNTEYLILKAPENVYVDAQNSYYAFYDENKNYISGAILQDGSILSPETVKYIRFSLEEKNREYIMFGEKRNLNVFYGKDKSYYLDYKISFDKRIDELDTAIKALNDKLNVSNYPEYYEAHLTSKIGVVQEKDLIYGLQGDTFAFITDTHIPENANNSPALLKKIVDNTNVSFVFDNGDVLTQAERSVAIQQAHNHIKNMVNTFGGKYKFTLGNHDDNRYLSSDKFSTNETYSLYMKHLEANNFNTFYESSEKFCYYFNNKKQKIRYIALDSNSGIINYNQLKWLADIGLKFDEEGWSVIIFTHWMFEENESGVNEFTNTTFVDVMSNIIHAFLNGASYNRSDLNIDVNYANKTGNCCAILCGHTHKDDSMTTQHGIQVICTTCDCYGYGARVDKKGTYEEQAFDICHLDTKNKKLYMTRIGYGEDREFNL